MTLQYVNPMHRILDGVLEPISTDLSTPVPYYGTGDPEEPTTVQVAPTEDETAQHIAEILLAGYGVKKTIDAVAAVVPGISVDIWKQIFDATGGLTGHAAHARLNALELHPDGDGARVARSAAKREIVWRAAYLARAAARVQSDVAGGESIPTAIKDEIPNFRAHEQARRGRLDAAALVGLAAERHGDLLGWYINPTLHNEAECITANGHNFRASESTVIGDPGAVHRNCGCVPGPPIPGAGMVNDAIAAKRTIRLADAPRYGLRKVG